MATDGIDGIFVGRNNELSLLKRLLLDSNGEKRILLLLGDGGTGKTKLINQMLLMIKKEINNRLAITEPIDLFSTNYRHIDGIQRGIKDLIEAHPDLQEGSPFAEWTPGKTDTSEKFYECMRSLCAKSPLVVAFDTFENLDRVTSDWMFKDGVGGLQVPGLFCIVAGRPKEKVDIDLYRSNQLVHEVIISDFTYDDTNEFYRKILDENIVSINSSQENVDPLVDLLEEVGLSKNDSLENNIEWIRRVTKGHPLRLEMVIRWAGTLLKEKSLERVTEEKFEEQLMLQVREMAERGQFDNGVGKKISQPVYDTLLCMSHITRRFDENFLRHFVDQGLIRWDDPSVEVRDIIKTLERYFFVKVRQDSGQRVIQLHDEMARLVREYIWPYHDPSGEKKQALLSAAEEYYDQLISHQDGKEREILQVERLYYILQRDAQEGLQEWLMLAELRNRNINELLPSEIKRYIKGYDLETQMWIHSRIAEMERNGGHLKQATGHWRTVKELGELNGREDWVVDSFLGLFNCQWMTEPEKALKEYLLPAQNICEKSFPKRLANIYYSIGFAHRQMQDLKQASKYYEKAEDRLRDYPDTTHLRGILLNDMGYVFLNLGRWGEAGKYLGEALNFREQRLHMDEERLHEVFSKDKVLMEASRNQSALFVGLSRNTLGEYHRYVDELDEALRDYDEAYRHFVDVNDNFWQAKCLCARGEAYRRLAFRAWEHGRSKTVIDDLVMQSRKDIEYSLYLCEKYQLDDERDSAYRRLGRLAHDLALMAHKEKRIEEAQERMEEAYRYFQRGVEFAMKTRETLEELENLMELAFLADDALVIYGEDLSKEFKGAIAALENGLKKHKNEKPQIYQYPVFEALLKMEQAAIAYAEDNYPKAMKGYIEAFKGLGTSPGYGHARYRQHFGHLTGKIRGLARDEQVRWCKEFVKMWEKTPMPDRVGKTLKTDLLPDLVAWCNLLVQN